MWWSERTAQHKTIFWESIMSTIFESLMVIAVLVFAVLFMFSWMSGENPWRFASRPHRWLIRTTWNWARRNLRRLWRRHVRPLLGRTIRFLLRQAGRGLWWLTRMAGRGLRRLGIVVRQWWLYFWRNFQTASEITLAVIIATIVLVTLVIAGFI